VALEAKKKSPFIASWATRLKRLRGYLRRPSIRLSYFEEVLAVEHAAINERRRMRQDPRHKDPQPPLQRLAPREGTDGDHPLPKSCALPPPSRDPQMSVDPANLDTNRMRARPIPCTAVGIALSGGGIRSAAFCLGALQALDFHHVVPHADYLSTVSGGGYIGACVTAGMSENGGAFPFGTSDVRDNDAIGHLRNYSNYLLPRAHSNARNLLEAAAVLLRGLLANAILVMVFLLGAALLTKAAYPAWDDLLTANFLPKIVAVLVQIPKYLAGLLPGFAWVNTLYATIGSWIGWITSRAVSLIPDGTAAGPFRTTIAVSAILAGTLIIWAITRSAKDDVANDVDSPYLVFARALLALTAISVFLDLQPLSIHWVAEHYASVSFKSFPPSVLASLAGAATTIALFAQKLGAFLETTRLCPDVANPNPDCAYWRRPCSPRSAARRLLVSDRLPVRRKQGAATRHPGRHRLARCGDADRPRRNRPFVRSERLFASPVLQGPPQQGFSVPTRRSVAGGACGAYGFQVVGHPAEQ
jgi:hypothetical protein